jgi:subtilase family serine protease
MAAPVGQAAQATTSPSHGVTVAHACAAPTKKGEMACNALQVTAGTPRSAHAESALTAATAPSGYGPASLQAAYNLPSATAGSGRTVAIVDAYDDPNAEADLAVYRSQYGLPACTTANGCFTKVDQSGGTKYPRGNSGWAEEISLDLDMVSAACPNCKILLVEASSSTMTNLGTAVNTAVRLGAKFVSNSYGGSESSSDATYDSSYFNHPGVAITVSSGDNGYGVEYPAASKYVTAVGGTSLTTSSTTRGWTDTVWSGAGSGCSSYDAKPSWQKDTGCANRTVADVSAVADPNTGVAVYDTYSQGTGWMVFGGTSASAPLIAATYALAGAPSTGSTPASFPYAHTSALYDVTSGSNGSCGGSYLCTATTGYDGPSGLGVPDGTAAFTG